MIWERIAPSSERLSRLIEIRIFALRGGWSLIAANRKSSLLIRRSCRQTRDKITTLRDPEKHSEAYETIPIDNLVAVSVLSLILKKRMRRFEQTSAKS